MLITTSNTILSSQIPKAIQQSVAQKRVHTLKQNNTSKDINFSNLNLKSIDDSDADIYRIDDLNSFVHEQTKYQIAIRDAVYDKGDLTAGVTAYSKILDEITQQYATDTEGFTKAKASLDKQYEHFATSFSDVLAGLTDMACGTGSIKTLNFKSGLTRAQRVEIATDTKAYIMNMNPSVQTNEAQKNTSFTQDDITNLVQVFLGDKDHTDTYLDNFLEGIDTNIKISSSLQSALHNFVVFKYHCRKF